LSAALQPLPRTFLVAPRCRLNEDQFCASTRRVLLRWAMRQVLLRSAAGAAEPGGGEAGMKLGRGQPLSPLAAP